VTYKRLGRRDWLSSGTLQAHPPAEMTDRARRPAHRSGQPSSTTHRASRSRPVSASGALRLGILRRVRGKESPSVVVKAVEANVTHEQRWIMLYVRRWLAAPIVMPDGRTEARDKGPPQGSAVSPVLANLFMHYAFDKWLEREFPTVEFERYADDAVVHCATEQQARRVLAALEERMAEVGLQLHPDKTRIVYCKDRNRRRSNCADTSFTFLGYTFRARQAPARQGGGVMFSAFLPAASKDALKRMSEEVRSWRIHLRSGTELEDIAAWVNPVVRGWMAYYGRFYRTALNSLLQRINTYLVRWAKRKYKRLRTFRKVRKWWEGLTARQPRLFSHWAWMTDFKYSL
jgi:RNA-directed DNA polymerase